MTDYVSADEWYVPWSLPEREGQRVRKMQGTSATAAEEELEEEERLEEIEEERQPWNTTVPQCNLTQL